MGSRVGERGQITIEKAIRAANLGLNPTSDGKLVRIPIPTLTEERRKEMSKLVHKFAEEAPDPAPEELYTDVYAPGEENNSV